MSRGNNWIALDKNLVQEFKSIKRDFSMIEAMYSYSFDINCGKVGTISGYAKQWNWSRNKVRRFIKGIRTAEGHLKDSKRTHQGHPIHFIDNTLMTKKDSRGTDEGQMKDSGEDTTIKPNLKPNPKPKKKVPKKNCFKDYLQDQIIKNNFIETKDKIFEFYEYRMSMPAQSRYKTEKGINGLFRDLNGCRKTGLVVSDCLEEAMEREWKTPNPTYFNNNKKSGFQTRADRNKEECEKFING